VLVDEYDKPILDNLTRPETAREMRDGLRNLYSVIKGQDAHIRFAFLTGVSKFSKVSIFSGLNNLNDITIDPEYSTLCGYTQGDLETVFAPELDGLDRAEVRRWYNGYNWTGEAVYNPFDLLLLFQKREFRTWWFETGTPTFLVDILTQRGFFTPDLAHLRADEGLLSTFDVD
ncbi:AAA family ATPase, partial [Thiocystis violacea]|uniref:AAA family ATPase n=1 Tax=Thiocystis violacea TaxID=13725 RepID=UPI0019076CAB